MKKEIWLPSEDDRKTLMQYASGSLGLQYQDAQDLFQDAMINYWNHVTRDAVRGPVNPKAFFAVIMKNLFIDKAKKKKKKLEFSVDFMIRHMDEFIYHQVDCVCVEHTLENYLNSLSGDARNVLTLYTEGKEKKEIVRLLNISPVKVDNILRMDRGLGHLIKETTREISKILK
jgi:RNA polymerase sigma factor (sigma-70 family)